MVFLMKKILDMQVLWPERGHMLLKLRSRNLRTGRAPKDLKILLSKLFSLKFKCVSLLSLKLNLSIIKYVSKKAIYIYIYIYIFG